MPVLLARPRREDVTPFSYRLHLTPFGATIAYCDPTGEVRSERAEDLEKRTRKMARNTLQPALGVSFLPSSTDLGLYTTGISTIRYP